MRLRSALLVATTLAVPALAHAQPISGPYVSLGAGGNLLEPSYARETSQLSFSGDFAGEPPRRQTGVSAAHFDLGATGLASIGYGFGNGLRIEAEGDYRYNSQKRRTAETPRQQSFGGMANALFDLDIGSPYIYPYLGAGIGYTHVDPANDEPPLGAFAYQGIFGLAFPIAFVPGLSATLEYRFMGISGTSRREQFSSPSLSASTTVKSSNDYNNSVLVGLRYAFDVVPPAPVPAEMPAAAPVAAAPRSYLVFFDWDRSDLTARARQIIAEAATTARQGTTRIDVQGNADRSGTPGYNLALSRRRADSVAAELVRDGFAAKEIDIEAFGDTKPLVATAAGVREAQNRRVAIVLH